MNTSVYKIETPGSVARAFVQHRLTIPRTVQPWYYDLLSDLPAKRSDMAKKYSTNVVNVWTYFSKLGAIVTDGKEVGATWSLTEVGQSLVAAWGQYRKDNPAPETPQLVRFSQTSEKNTSAQPKKTQNSKSSQPKPKVVPIQPQPEQPPAAQPTSENILDALVDMIANAVVIRLQHSSNSIPSSSDSVKDVVDLVRENEDLKNKVSSLQSEINHLGTSLRSSGSSVTTTIGQAEAATTRNVHKMKIKDDNLRDLLTLAEQQGFEVTRTGSNHYKVLPPDESHRPIFHSSTPSDHRALKNFRSEMIRAGLKV